MSRPGITYREVAEAALKIQGNQENPTVDRVREVLGTGSKSTIARYLKEWKAQVGDSAETGIPSELLSLVQGLWERLKAERDHAIAAHQEEKQQEINALQEKLTRLEIQYIELQSQYQRSESQYFDEQQQSAMLRQSIEQEKNHNATLCERNEQSQRQLTEQKSEIERLHQLLTHVQTHFEHFQHSAQKRHEEHVRQQENQRSSYEQKIQIHLTALSELKVSHAQSERDCQTLQTDLQSVRAQLNSASDENHHLQNLLKEKISFEAALLSQFEQLARTAASYETMYVNLSEKSIDLEKKQAVLLTTMEELKMRYQTAEDVIHSLQHEKCHLMEEKGRLEAYCRLMTPHDATSTDA